MDQGMNQLVRLVNKLGFSILSYPFLVVDNSSDYTVKLF